MLKTSTETANYCDVCDRRMGYIKHCLVCKREYCPSCQFERPGIVKDLFLCFHCGKRPDVLPLCEAASERIQAIDSELCDALRGLQGDGKKR